MTNTQTHVAVLMGGWSSEREVSLRSGEACAAALEAQGYRATRLDVGRDVATRLTELRPDVCFNALHGRFGEDGCIQGVLETLGIPYTHSGVLASALAMHKERAKTVMRAAGVPVAEAVVLTREEAARAHAMPPPYVIKPVTEGSSVGVFIVREDQRHPPQELHAADWTLGEELMVERYIPGRELTCAVMGEEASGGDRDSPGRGADLLRLHLEIRPRRLDPRASGAAFTKCLPIGTEAVPGGPSGTGLPWRQPFRFPIR